MERWVKINTDIVGHWLWQKPEYLKWWLDILIMASWKECKQLVGRQDVNLKRGQLVASVSFLCKRWGKSRKTVETFLNLMQKKNMISKKVDRNISIITVTKYKIYQDTKGAYLGTDLWDNQKDCKSMDYVNNGAHQGDTFGGYQGDTFGDTFGDTKEASLKYGSTYCKSTSSKDAETEVGAHLGTDIRVQKGGTIDNYYILNQRFKNNNSNNILSSLRSDSYSDKESELPSDEICFSEFVKFFNAEMDANNAVIPRLRKIEGKRRNHILARNREFGKSAVKEMVQKAARSDFLNGKNARGWIASFSWMILPNNFLKVIEGNYDNKPKAKEYGTSGKERQNQRRGTEVEASSDEDYSVTF